MVYSQGKPEEITEFLTIGGLQLGTPRAKQQWIDEFLASRRQGLSMRTLEFYRDILYQAIDIELTPNGINSWLTNLNCGMLSISEMGHFLNRTLWHNQVALTSSLRPWL